MLIRTLELFLLLTIFLTPIIPSSFGFGFELIKVLTFLSLTILAGLIFVYLLSKKKLKVHWSKIKIAGLVFLIILSITSLLGIHPGESLVGKYPYFQGLILYWLLLFFSLMVSSINIKKDLLNKVISVSALIVGLLSIWQFIQLNLLGIQIPSYAGRVVSTFGQPNLYSGFLLLSLPLIFNTKRRSYIIMLIVTAAVVLSLSKAAIAILSGAGLWFFLSKLKQKGLAIYLLILCFINILVFSLDNSSGIFWDEVIKPLTLGRTDTGTIEKRAHILPVLFEIYSGSPVMGFGIDSINSLYTQKFAGFSPETVVYSPVDFNLKNLIIDRSHNYFLDLLIFSGILGLVCYSYLIFALFKTSAPKPLKFFLILYLIWVQFQVQSIAHLLLFWLIVGVIDNRKYLSDDEF